MTGDPAAAPALAPRARALRVTVLGGTSLALATGAHLVGGGALPGPGLLTVLAVVLGLIAVPLTRRRCRMPLLIAALGAEQLALHLVFGAAAGLSGCVAAGAHHAQVLGCTPTAAVDAGRADAVMLVGHVLAVLITAWVLARGEAWLWRTVDEAVRAAHAGLTWSAISRNRPSPAPALLVVAVRPDGPLPPRGPPNPR